MKNIKMTIAYDGTNYLGWQKTSTKSSIEEHLQTALEKIIQEPVVLQAASRTDAGVHAREQVVNFFTYKENISFFKLVHSLNCMLPKDIVVLDAEMASDAFHPTLDNKGKEYHYHIFYGAIQYPHLRRTSWHYPQELNIASIREAAQLLVGTHDFGAFCNLKRNQTYEHYIRTITRLEIIELKDQNLRIEIEGNNFLYKMVRNLVGTLVYIGSNKIELSQLKFLLENGDRTQAGITAPAHGLFLNKVFY